MRELSTALSATTSKDKTIIIEQDTEDYFQRSLDYWEKKLCGVPEMHGFPLDEVRPAQFSATFGQVNKVLSKSVKEKLERFSLARECTRFSIIYTCLSALLHRYSGDKKLAIGVPADCARTTIWESKNQPCASPVTLCLDFSDDHAMSAYLNKCVVDMNSAYQNHVGSFEDLVDKIGRVGALNHHPVFQIMLKESSLDKNPTVADQHAKKCDLVVSIAKNDEEFSLTWDYAQEIFKPQTISRLAQHFCILLEKVLDNPDQRVSEVTFLESEETQQQLTNWNCLQKYFPRDLVVTDLVERQAQDSPDATAVVFANEQLTYKQLNSRANKLARYLIDHGVGADDLVALSMQRCENLIVAVLGILKAGATYVPIDPEFPEVRTRGIMDDAQCKFTIADVENVAFFASITKTAIDLGDTKIQQALAKFSEVDLSKEEKTSLGITPDVRAYIIFTSGSTGRPKGVEITHRGIVNMAQEVIRVHQIDRQSRVLQFASISFDAAVAEWCTALVAGACLIVPRQATLKDMSALDKLVVDQAVSHAMLPPAILPELSLKKWSGVTNIIIAGDKCSLELAKTWCKNRVLVNGYGPSEATVGCTTAQIRQADTKMHIGKPMANMKVYVLDQYRNLLPAGVPGELYIGGVGLARGYLNRPELTAERFVPDPFSLESHARMYKTGDQVRWLPDGNLEFLGRLDNQVKISGYRIELGEIETRLSQHPDIVLAAVKKIEHMGESALSAWYTTKSGVNLNRAELRFFLKKELPVYMIPSFFVEMPVIQLNSSGKIDRSQLPHPAMVFRKAV